jgi:hypothetical protein
LTLASGLYGSYAKAQLNFALSQPAGTYTANTADTTVIIAAGQDDKISSVQTIPFNFKYGCDVYTQFRASSNGWMSLGNSTLANLNGNDLTTTGNGPILAPLWDDLAVSSTGTVNYRVSGSAPNRVLIIEWRNMRWNSGATGITLSFQVKLYETTNVIEYIYRWEGGSAAGTGGSGGASIGLNGGYSAGDYYSLRTSGATPTVDYGAQTSNITALPASNQVYRWTPQNMTYVSCTSVQGTTAGVSKCNNLNQAILGIQVVTRGCGNPLSVTQIQFNMGGSTIAGTNTNDVTNIHIYYTATSAGFAPANEFKSGGITVASGTITVTGSQALVAGTNYFWIAYDVNATSAITGHLLDAQCTWLTVGVTSATPTLTNPSGSRSIADCSAAPGGITNMSFWVKANAGTSTTTDGAALATWNDQSGNVRNAAATATANSPAYKNNSSDNINFNPVVKFNATVQAPGSSSFMPIASNGALSTGNNPYEVYAVVKPGTGNSSTAGKFLFAGSGLNGYNAFDVRGGNAVNDSWDVNDLTVGSTWTAGNPCLATFDFNSVQREIFISGGSAGTKAGHNRWSVDAFNALGCQYTGSTNTEFYDGGIAEIITYANAAHDVTTRNKVESYLALKYGITLQHNYLASNAAVIWNRSLNASYNDNIIGLARDDMSGLSQKQSKSTSASGDMLTMYIGATKQVNQASNTGTFSGGDRSFFMAGSNGAPILFSAGMTTDRPAGICCRLQRVWLSQKTNFTNTDLTLQFDFNNVAPGYTPLFASDLRLLVDDDGVFSNATVLSSPTITVSVNASVVTVVVPAASITAAKPYFTLASAAINTPLPVTIKSFSASCQDGMVLVSWEMGSGGSYGFTIERSVDGTAFMPVGQPAADASGRTSYGWKDASSLAGEAAYRLKAIDNSSGAVVYSNIVPVASCGGEDAVRAAMDPGTGRSSMLVLQLQRDAAVDIACYDLLGHRLEMPGLTGRRSMAQGVYRLSIPERNLASGVYLLSVIINDKRSVIRIIQ